MTTYSVVPVPRDHTLMPIPARPEDHCPQSYRKWRLRKVNPVA